MGAAEPNVCLFQFGQVQCLFALAWWGWALLFVFGLLVLSVLALRRWRAGVRRRFIAFLQRSYPDIRVTETGASYFLFESPTLGNGRCNLDNLFNLVSQSKAASPQEEAVFDKFLSGLVESVRNANRKMTLAEDGEHLLPRLVNAAHLAELQEQGPVPSIPLDETKLSVVFVRDAKDAVSYLSEAHIVELGIDLTALRQRAIENLRKKTPDNFVRATIEKGSLQMFKFGDTFDAARLLLVPDQLREGEMMAAIIPDRDTLALLPMPEGTALDGLHKLARAVAGPPLCHQPLRVTSKGFELIAK